MANADVPRGFIPLKSDGKQVRAKEYRFAGNEAAFKGDLLVLLTDGTVDVYDNGDGKCLGVAAADAAVTDSTILVYDDPDGEFIAQCDGTFALTDIGANADVLATNGSANRSAHEIQSASFALTATLPIKILGLHDVPSGNAVGANALVRCKLNNTVLGGGDGSTGLA